MKIWRANIFSNWFQFCKTQGSTRVWSRPADNSHFRWELVSSGDSGFIWSSGDSDLVSSGHLVILEFFWSGDLVICLYLGQVLFGCLCSSGLLAIYIYSGNPSVYLVIGVRVGIWQSEIWWWIFILLLGHLIRGVGNVSPDERKKERERLRFPFTLHSILCSFDMV